MKERPLSQLAKILGLTLPSDRMVSGGEFDSRKVLSGQLFFALKGEKADGHAFLKEVAAKGAVGAVVSKEYSGDNFGLPLLKVKNVTTSLQLLAKTVMAERKGKIVAITGSVGKTTTKEFIATLLQAQYRVAKTPGNANSQVAVPVSILNAGDDEEIYVLEMGMSEPGEMKKLVDMAPPHAAVLTKVGLAHSASFPDGLAGIGREKAQIFSHPRTTFRLCNADCAHFVHGEKHTFSLEEGADFVLKTHGDKFSIMERGKPTQAFSLHFSATHLCENFLASFALARHMGMSAEAIFAQAKHLTTVSNRFEKIEKNGVVIINDAYNANPLSMRAAFANLPKPTGAGKRIAVLGAMRPLGTFSEKCHQEIGEEALSHFDHLLCIGEECQAIASLFHNAGRPAEYFTTLNALRARLDVLAKPGDVVLIKGSNALNLWTLF